MEAGDWTVEETEGVPGGLTVRSESSHSSDGSDSSDYSDCSDGSDSCDHSDRSDGSESSDCFTGWLPLGKPSGKKICLRLDFFQRP